MDHHDYLAWLSEIDDLSPDQRIGGRLRLSVKYPFKGFQASFCAIGIRL